MNDSEYKEIVDLLNELKVRTYLDDAEHAIVSFYDGTRALIRGSTRQVTIGNANQVRRLMIHTHPYGRGNSGPSNLDYSALKELGQTSSYLLENGVLQRFRR